MFGTLHRVINTHQWLTGAQCCGHEKLTGQPANPDGNKPQYFRQHKSAFHAFHKTLTDKRWLKSLRY